MILNIVWLILSLAAILIGANMLVDGSSAIARRFGLSDLVVGLTVVAFGTSTPELAISAISAIQGSTELAVGNVVGSNIFNILIIIGITALVRPIKVDRDIMTSQMPLMVLSALVLLVLGNTALLDGGGANVIDRVNGIFLLLLFVLFMIYTVKQAHTGAPGTSAPQGEAEEVDKKASMGIPKSILWVIIGLAGLVWGGDKFVDSASALASALGMSEAMIGLTIVAAGTSMPELATSIVAAIKGRSGLAVGNVIGSNIFNTSMVLGAAATIRPLSFGSIGNVDLLVLTFASLLFWLLGRVWGDHVINRAEGALMTATYVGYTAFLIWQL